MDFIFQDVENLGLKLLGVCCVILGIAIHACLFYADLEKGPPFKFSNYNQMIRLLGQINQRLVENEHGYKTSSTPYTRSIKQLIKIPSG